MKIEDVNKLIDDDVTIKFTVLFGGTFFLIHLGDAVYENKNGCYKLNDYESTIDLIRESVKENKNLLEKTLEKVKHQNT